MANAEQVKALVKSIANGDEEHFVSVALQFAASEAKAGRSTLAEELRDLADEIKRNRNGSRLHRAVPITKPTGELAGLLTAVYPQTRFAEMVLEPQTLKKTGASTSRVSGHRQTSRAWFAATSQVIAGWTTRLRQDNDGYGSCG